MNTITITSGIYKGQTLSTPGDGTHPMGARERLALFNMVGNNLTGTNVLDAYAGSGILGAEALSRQATRVVFIEKSPKAAQAIRSNLKKIASSASSNPPLTEVICQDVKQYQTDFRFELILADPPYDSFDLSGVNHLTKFLTPEGIFVLSHPDTPPELPNLKLLKTHQYARAHLSIYQA